METERKTLKEKERPWGSKEINLRGDKENGLEEGEIISKIWEIIWLKI